MTEGTQYAALRIQGAPRVKAAALLVGVGEGGEVLR